VPGTLTINPATLTILVNSFTKVYGTENPTLTGSVRIVDGDSISFRTKVWALQIYALPEWLKPAPCVPF
jgi:hypothetical protein